MPVYCTKCGYNLRGLGPGRCPECGGAFDPLDIGTVSLEAKGNSISLRRGFRRSPLTFGALSVLAFGFVTCAGGGGAGPMFFLFFPLVTWPELLATVLAGCLWAVLFKTSRYAVSGTNRRSLVYATAFLAGCGAYVLLRPALLVALHHWEAEDSPWRTGLIELAVASWGAGALAEGFPIAKPVFASFSSLVLSCVWFSLVGLNGGVGVGVFFVSSIPFLVFVLQAGVFLLSLFLSGPPAGSMGKS